MKQQQKADINALEQTLLCVSQHPTEVALLPNPTPFISGITTNLKTLFNIDTQVQGLTKINALSKTDLRKALTNLTLQLAARGTAFASNTNNTPLAQVLDTKISTLQNMSDITFRDYAQLINNTLAPLVATLDPIYRITVQEMTDHQTLIADYTTAIPSPTNRATQIKNLNTPSSPTPKHSPKSSTS
jgi:hypothetical protein